MEKIKYIFFDNDGVLLDTEKIVFDCNTVIKRFYRQWELTFH